MSRLPRPGCASCPACPGGGLEPHEPIGRQEAPQREQGPDHGDVRDDRLIAAMAALPILIRRPIVPVGKSGRKSAVIGRPPEAVSGILQQATGKPAHPPVTFPTRLAIAPDKRRGAALSSPCVEKTLFPTWEIRMAAGSFLSIRFAALLLFGLLVAGHPAAAFGFGGSDSNEAASNTGNEEVGRLIANAEDFIDDEQYKTAIAVLDQALAKEPDNADILNYLGYSYRKLGNRPKALEYYAAALAQEPEHLGANEYLGELYLQMDDLANAEERLAVLAKACDSDCEEFDELEDAIAEYKEANGLS